MVLREVCLTSVNNKARTEKANQILCKGSAAAAMQSIIGPVQAQSIFALVQSAATGGVGLAVINGMISAGAGVGMGVVAGTIAGEEGCLSDSKKKETCHGETNAR